MNILIFALYRSLLAPLLFALVTPLLFLFNRKVREGLRARRQKQDLPTFAQPPIWIHAASGEFEYAKPFIRELKKKHPQIPILVTYFSTSFVKQIQNTKEVDFSCPLPLDLPGPVRSFLNTFKPRALFIARTDLWPELLYQVRARGIQSTLFSCTQKHIPVYRPFTRATKSFCYNLLSKIECVSAQDKDEIENLGVATPVRVAGDTRYDQVFYRLAQAKPVKDSLKPSGNLLISGSTWSEDERVLLHACLPHLKNRSLKLMLVPHEPSEKHIYELVERTKKLGLRSTLYSTANTWDSEVLIVDQIGILAELYQWGDLAFVGGSFKRTVHSVMEPLAAGCITFVGPNHENNREALECKTLGDNDLKFVQAARSEDEFSRLLNHTLLNQARWPGIKERILKHMRSRQGATSIQIEGIELAQPLRE